MSGAMGFAALAHRTIRDRAAEPTANMAEKVAPGVPSAISNARSLPYAGKEAPDGISDRLADRRRPDILRYRATSLPASNLFAAVLKRSAKRVGAAHAQAWGREADHKHDLDPRLPAGAAASPWIASRGGCFQRDRDRRHNLRGSGHGVCQPRQGPPRRGGRSGDAGGAVRT